MGNEQGKKKKGFWAGIAEKLDKKLKESADKPCCGNKNKQKDGPPCCSG